MPKIMLYDEERDSLIVDVEIDVEGEFTNGDWELFREKELMNKQYPENKIINISLTTGSMGLSTTAPVWLICLIAYWFGFQMNKNYTAIAINNVIVFSFNHEFETGYRLPLKQGA